MTHMTEMAPTVLDVRKPFSRDQARAAGVPLARLLSREFHRVGHDQYVAAAVPITTKVRAQAALNIAPAGSFVSHHTAAELWGAVVPATCDTHVSLPTDRGRSVRRGVQCHVAPLGSCTTTLRGLRISTPEQAFLELAAAGANLVELVVAGDGLAKKKRTTPEALIAAAEESSGRSVRVARRAAGLVRLGVDSPMESRTRMLLVLAGLPEPEVNLILRGLHGEWRRRFDMYYKRQRVLVEFDGRQHAENEEQWEGDIYRREELDQRGERLIVVTRRGIYDEPLRTLERVRTALVERGATGLPRRFRPEWERYFPGRKVDRD